MFSETPDKNAKSVGVTGKNVTEVFFFFCRGGIREFAPSPLNLLFGFFYIQIERTFDKRIKANSAFAVIWISRFGGGKKICSVDATNSPTKA